MEFSALFAQSAREVLPLARNKHLVSYFDYHGPFIDLPGSNADLRGGIHRVLRGMIDCIDAGFVLFSADVERPRSRMCKIRVHAAGTGAFAERIERVLERLQLTRGSLTHHVYGGEVFRATGVCPATGGNVAFVNSGPDGLLLSLELSLAAVEVPGAEPLPDAAGVTAWLVSPIAGGLDSVGRRLRRLGWGVKSFGSLEQASALLTERQGSASAFPMLLVVVEVTGSELPELERINRAAPSLWTVLAVLAGSKTVQVREGTSVDIRLLPLSPIELEHFTAHVDRRTSTDESRETSPAPLYGQDTCLVLVVDDSPVNQLIARGQLEVLGYDVAVATNGAEALDACCRRPPDMVLMDVDMPVMDGLEATTRLRNWQQVGRLPPFPIVAATSGDGTGRRNECAAAGMDGYLSKPLNLQTLADEVHRVLPPQPVPHGAASPGCS